SGFDQSLKSRSDVLIKEIVRNLSYTLAGCAQKLRTNKKRVGQGWSPFIVSVVGTENANQVNVTFWIGK
ncbi:MAG TPA: hypothetical protein VGK99_22055, partial [Acidobacteriota bacterium]